MVTAIIALYSLIFFIVLRFISDNIPEKFERLFNGTYTLIEYTFFTYFLFININKVAIKKLIGFSFVLFLFAFLIYLNLTNLRYDTVLIGVETILVLIYIFLFFYEYFNNIYTEYIYTNYCFWLSIGMLLYLSGSFFIYILTNHFTHDERTGFWFLTYIVETIKNGFFSLAIFIYARDKTKQKKSIQNIPYLDFN